MDRLVRFGLALMLAGIIVLVGTMSPAFGKNVHGTVVSMDGGILVVRSMDGVETTYTLGTTVVIPADVKVGTMVDVTTGEGENASMVTTIVAVPVSGTTPSAAETPSAGTPATTAADPATEESELPATASKTWALGLLGAVLLAGVLSLNRRRRARPRVYYSGF